nr:ATPase [uncultured Anaerocolumna sp.]
MGVSRIEQLIEDIYEFIESCRMQPLSTTKVIVPKDELYDLLDELRLRTPDEIKRYQKIIANRDAIIADAEEKAASILAQADEKAHTLVNEHEIMQQAYYEANEMVSKAAAEANKIVADANNDANQIRSSALVYTEDMLSDVERILAHTYESTKNKYESLIHSMQGNLEIVINNKKELRGQEYEVPQQVNEPSEPEEGEREGEDFEFDENTFLQDL